MIDKIESVLAIVSTTGVLFICGYAYHRQRFPGWLAMAAYSFCWLLASIVSVLLRWESSLIRQDVLISFLRCDSYVCDLLLVVAVGMLAARWLPSGHRKPNA